MKKPETPANEDQRLAALQRYGILDTLPEQAFDDLTLLASHICDAPISLVSLVDAHRQWFKSRHGIDAEETEREIAFCAHAIHGDELFEVPNALEDERFHDNPLVTGEPKIRFYAGAPLITPNGHGLGTICVIDRKPKKLAPTQADMLMALSRQAVLLLESRLQMEKIVEDSVENERLRRRAEDGEQRLRLALRDVTDGLWDWNIGTNEVWLDDRFRTLLGLPQDDQPIPFEQWCETIRPDDAPALQEALDAHREERTPLDIECRCRLPSDEYRTLRFRGQANRNPLGRAKRIAGSIVDVTPPAGSA